MNFNITLIIDTEASKKSILINNLSLDMQEYFSTKDYGEDLQNYTLGFKCVFTPDGFKNFFKKKKPVYVSDRISTNRFTGEKHHMYKLFIDNITIEAEEYEDFVSGSDYDSLHLVKSKILESLSNLDKLPKSVKDFDKERFKEDMKIVLGYSD